MILAAITVYIIDGKFRNAALWAIGAASSLLAGLDAQLSSGVRLIPLCIWGGEQARNGPLGYILFAIINGLCSMAASHSGFEITRPHRF